MTKVYFIRCSRTGLVIYIGITKYTLKTRFSGHKSNGAVYDWVQETGNAVRIDLVAECTERKSAEQLEFRLIYFHQTMYPGRLLNKRKVTVERRVSESYCLVEMKPQSRMSRYDPCSEIS